MPNNYDILKQKIKAFRDKYYLYEFLRGLIITLSTLIVLFVIFSIVEYNVYLSAYVRKIIFYGYLFFSLLLVIQFVAIPLFKLLHILKPLDTKELIKIIQQYFPEIKDKLLNVVELHAIKDDSYSDSLLSASIDQKIEDLQPFNFKDAIKLDNLKYIFIYLIISLLLVFGIILFNKNIITDSTKRIVHFNNEYTKPAPYQFRLVNNDLKVKKGEAITIQLKCKGNEIPQVVYINIEGNNYLMQQQSDGNFTFEMQSVINPVNFYFTDLQYISENYHITLLPKPGISSFTTKVIAPSYTNIEQKTYENFGDITVANGSNVIWNFTGFDIDSLYIVYNDSIKIVAEKKSKTFHVSHNFFESTNYQVFVRNNLTDPEMALTYSVEVIPDIYPEIAVDNFQDSLQFSRYYFKGAISDDYGFKNLKFHYNINNQDSSILLQINKNNTNQEFYYSFDFSTVDAEDGLISYYFSVSDNDVISGYKTTTSKNFTFEIPSKEEIEKSDNEQFTKLEKMLNESQKIAKEIQDDLKDLQLKNMDNTVSQWEKSKMVDNIVKKQNQLERLYDQIKQQNEYLNKYLETFDKPSEELLAKQEEIKKLLDEVFTDEMKKLLEEFNKLSEEFNSKKFNELSKEMNMTYDDVEDQLDRNLEMLKKMKIEQKFQSAIDDVNALTEKHKQLSDKINNDHDFEGVKKEIEEDLKELNRIQEKIDDAIKKNSELKEPMSLDDFSLEKGVIEKSMNDAIKEIEKRSKKSSSKQIKKTTEQLENMAFAMQKMLDANKAQEATENIEDLKQLLSNLLYLSFEQENILTSLRSINSGDPLINTLNQNQLRLNGLRKSVKDSLQALALRTPAISNMVNTELQQMELQMEKAKDQMEEGNFSSARTNQQFAITSINNLALMLNESLDQLENQQQKDSSSDCDNPGSGSNGKPKMGKLKKQAQSIKDQLQKMIDEMKKGNKQGGNQPKNSQLGKALQQHEMMQKMLRDLMNGEEIGSGAKEMLKEIDNMLDKNRKQLMNKRVNAQMLKRQNLISTRLLKAENAEKERDFDDKRESKSAEEFYSNPVEFFKNKKDDKSTIEYLQKNTHKLHNFYQNKYKSYLEQIDKNKKE